MNRLILLVESRIRGDVYVRFGGELPKTHRSNTAGRWMLSLPFEQVAEAIADMTGIRLNNISEADDKLSAFNNDDTFLIINEISVV